ncbi:galactokinase [uncultured Shewanella sp.]|uniref:galactokinase n=1 Tax=uncultured Shewanella sp. TaxID=173975 RepID=UPI00261E0104|nr:galactokinase [uncultured Shewanella sp.]
MSNAHIVSELFSQQYLTEPEWITHAPGRVNLLGDHTDYNDGFVLPVAINFGTYIAASRRNDKIIRVYAHDCAQETAEFSLDRIQFNAQQMWVNYVAGTLQILAMQFPDVTGADLVVSGNVPQGAGLSSSASFEIAILKVFNALFDLGLDGVKAALLGQQAENEFVGCNCGIMDQLVSAMGEKDHAMLLDCRSLTFENVFIPKDLSLYIVNSNVKRGLVDSEYNQRRLQCEKVAHFFNREVLRDVSLVQLNTAKSQLEPVLYKRARHVITENIRTQAAFKALRDNNIVALSVLMKESHLSLRNDFEVTTKEMDGLVDIIDDVLGNTGAVRMTGGGFGGCVVALVPTHAVQMLTSVIGSRYSKMFGLVASIYVCKASVGAFSG